MIVQGRETRSSQVLHRFENGYGASVISDGYGAQSGLLELAVIKWSGDDYELTYETPITSDVLGYLTAEEVNEKLAAVEALTARDIHAEAIARKRAEVAELQGRIDDLNADIARMVAS